MTHDLPSAAVTEALMLGAFRTAFGAPKPPDTLDLPRYVLALCRCWHTTHRTPELLETAARGLTAIGDHRSALFARRKAREETGHDVLVLKDLASLGLPASLPVTIPPANGLALVALFDRLAAATAPHGVFGYAFALEVFAALTPGGTLAEIQRLVPPGVDITRCLRVHSGGDARHVREIVERVADFDQMGREAVIAAIHETAPLIGAGADDAEGVARLTAHLDAIGWTAPAELETAS